MPRRNCFTLIILAAWINVVHLEHIRHNRQHASFVGKSKRHKLFLSDLDCDFLRRSVSLRAINQTFVPQLNLCQGKTYAATSKFFFDKRTSQAAQLFGTHSKRLFQHPRDKMQAEGPFTEKDSGTAVHTKALVKTGPPRKAQ